MRINQFRFLALCESSVNNCWSLSDFWSSVVTSAKLVWLNVETLRSPSRVKQIGTNVVIDNSGSKSRVAGYFATLYQLSVCTDFVG